MNLDFNVLWFEDDPDWYNSTIEEIKQILIDTHMLTLEPKYSDNSDPIKSKDIINNNNYDLICVDYNLAHGTKGNAIIEEIREYKIYTDIVFYSADYNGMVSNVKASEKLLSGVYYINREYFNDEVKKIVHKIVRRTETIENLRGLLSDKVSEFDKIMTEKILQLNEHETIINQKVDIKDYLKQMLEESRESYQNKITKIMEAQCPVSAACNTKTYILDSEKRSRLFQTMCNYYNNELLPKKFVEEYKKNILFYRNNLSHADIRIGGALTNGEQVDSNLFYKLRQHLVSIQKELKNVCDQIS